jgi:hypothetical protein
MQTRHWCFTINNWEQGDDDGLIALGPTVSYLVYGYETGESGTPHLQGYVIFPRVKRLSEAKGLLSGRAHLEPKRGTPEQAAAYCKKDGVFKEFGECPKSSGGGAGPFASFIEWVMSRNDGKGSVPSDREIAQAFPALFVRYSKKLRELATHHVPHPILEAGSDLRPWQEALKNVLLQPPPDDRSILFYVDDEGGKGKSWFQRYMLTNYPEMTQVLSAGKRDDIAHAIDESKSIFLFNIPRKAMEYFNYNIIEQLKDKMIFSPKYDSSTKILSTVPHVVVFSNEHPKMDDLTPDRYVIVEEF